MSEHKVICHAEGDRCHGCAHYQGKAPVCEFAPKAPPMSDAIPYKIALRAGRAFRDCALVARDKECIAIIARALMAAAKEADEAATKRAAATAKVVGETFLLDMTAKPEWQDSATWGRQETIRHIRAAILKGDT